MQSADENEGRTLQIVNEIAVADVLEPSTRWEVKREVLEGGIEQEFLSFVQERLPRLLYVVFTLRHDKPILTQVSFITHLADIIYQSWIGTHLQDGEKRLNDNIFARRYGGIKALCVALAIYAKTAGVKDMLISETRDNSMWMVGCNIVNMEEWRQRMLDVPFLMRGGSEKIII